eukprot:gnl/MRDRNA2_/MRDRNA2_96440_c0_seq1.p1 gnl/MRDRNA2_/MRDRNA2_96440_c0~~gnl/MRDRNA2_/MRDRNA2_96440_c0_seq1.p1  ORF type:complete len:307 (+),score=34.95 gnl/MRDRNA2_/MRDRNA2_96440_c0_seq1:125-1045(+)
MSHVIAILQLMIASNACEATQRSMPVDRLIDRLFDRALTESSHDAGLDTAVLGKPGGAVAMPRSTGLKSHFPLVHSHTPVASAPIRSSHLPQFHGERTQDGWRMGAAWPSLRHQRSQRSSIVRAGEGTEGERGTEPEPKPADAPGVAVPRNVLGGDLESCCTDCHGSGIGTGFYRDGFCSTGLDDIGRHTVCVEVTAEFLEFSKSIGNDLSSPLPKYLFPGVQPGDRWCLCALRWAQAYQAGMAPQVHLKATHELTLQHIELEKLMKYAVDKDEATAEMARLDDSRAMLERAFASPSVPGMNHTAL